MRSILLLFVLLGVSYFGWTQSRQQEIQKAQQVYNQGNLEKSLELVKEITSHLNELTSAQQNELFTLKGNIHGDLSNDSLAIDAYNIALSKLSGSGCEVNIIRAKLFSNLAGANTRLQKFEKAEDNLLRALKIFDDCNKPELKYRASIGYSSVLIELKRFKEGEVLLEELADYFRSNGLDFELSFVLNNHGNLLRDQGYYKRALPYYHASLHIKKRNGSTANSLTTLNNLYECHKSLQQFDSSLYYLEEYKTIGDSIRNEEIFNQMNAVEIQLKNERIEFLNSKNKLTERLLDESQTTSNQKSWLLVLSLIAIALLLLLSGTLFLLYRTIKRKNIEIEAMKNSLNATNEFNAVIIKTISHDLKNYLTGIQMVFGHIVKNRSLVNNELYPAIEEVNNTSMFLTKSLKDLLNSYSWKLGYREFETSMVNLKGLIEDDLQLHENLCREKQLSVTLEDTTENPIIRCNTELMQSVLRNLMFNAIKFSPKNRDISIQLHESENELHLDISNAYEVLESASEDSTGLGLKMSEDYVKFIGGHLQIEQNGHTFKVGLKIPLKK